ncbi:MAG: hypothetical protein ACRDJE_26985, partial [Dehalococcoidia bacterium]
MPIRLRMALLGIGVVALTLLLFSVMIYALVSRTAGRQQDETLSRRAEQAGANVAGVAAEDLQPQRLPATLDLRESGSTFVMVLGADGEVLSSTGEVDGAPPLVPPNVLATATRDGSAVATISPAAAVRLRVQVLPWSRSDLGLNGYVVVGSADPSQQGGVTFFLVLSGVVSLLVAAAAIWLVLGRA